MAEKPVISIVSGSYNRRKFIEATLNSIRNNGITVPYEIIIIDGGSSDGTMEYLVKQKDVITIVQHNREIVSGKSVKKHSWGYFMNLAFQMAKGKYVLMVSDDALLVPDSVMNAYNHFEAQLKAGRKVGAAAFYFRNYPNEIQYYVSRTLGETITVNHGMYLVDALEAAGWIEEDAFKFYYADYDLCLKIRQKGYEIIDSPDSYVEHTMYVATDVRNSNSINDDNLEDLVNRWRGIFYNEGDPKIVQPIYKDFNDPHETYKIVLKMAPKTRAVKLIQSIAPDLTQEKIKKKLFFK
jgi:GT2 family glycosyltransferase